MNELSFRFAEKRDTALILQFIKELADYEGLLNEVVATDTLLEEWIFDKKKAEVIFAVERGCGRLEWWCLDRNTPSVDFYLSMGAEPMSDWTVYHIAGETLSELAR